MKDVAQGARTCLQPLQKQGRQGLEAAFRADPLPHCKTGHNKLLHKQRALSGTGADAGTPAGSRLITEAFSQEDPLVFASVISRIL